MRVRLSISALGFVSLLFASACSTTEETPGDTGAGTDGRAPDGATSDSAAPDGSASDSATPDGSAPDTGATTDSSAPPDGGDAGPDGGPTDGATPPFDAGTCTAPTLADALIVSSLPGTSTRGRAYGAPTATNGAVVAFPAADGVHLLTLAADGTPIGSAVVIPGLRPYGLAVGGGTTGVLVSRGTDALYLVGIDGTGATVIEERLLGEVDHDVEGNEWFGNVARDARLAWTGTQWAVYHTVDVNMSRPIGVSIDRLRYLDADGTPDRYEWPVLGCSVSFEVRVTYDSAGLGSLCASNCYPSKGVHFNYREAALYTDDRVACSERTTTHLGGIATIGSGFLAAFTAGDGRSSEDVAIVRIDGGTAGTVSFLTADAEDDTSPNMASFGAGAVVGWVSAGANHLLRVDAAGSPVGSDEVVAAADLANAGDFFRFANGDAGWAISADGSLALARLRDCE